MDFVLSSSFTLIYTLSHFVRRCVLLLPEPCLELSYIHINRSEYIFS